MKNKRKKQIDNPWKAEAWQLRDWLCRKAEEESGNLDTRGYLDKTGHIAEQVLKKR